MVLANEHHRQRCVHSPIGSAIGHARLPSSSSLSLSSYVWSAHSPYRKTTGTQWTDDPRGILEADEEEARQLLREQGTAAARRQVGMGWLACLVVGLLARTPCSYFGYGRFCEERTRMRRTLGSNVPQQGMRAAIHGCQHRLAASARDTERHDEHVMVRSPHGYTHTREKGMI